jgi:hypothetical protein
MNSQATQHTYRSGIYPMTEVEAAKWYQDQGLNIIYHNNRYWKESRFSFYEPIHLLARLSADQANFSTRLMLGFRSSLRETDKNQANGSIPIHLLSNIRNYSIKNLSSNRRNHLRRCQKRAKIVHLTDLSLLEEEGYEVYVSAATRFESKHLITKRDYLSQLGNYSSFHKRKIIAATVNGRLGGYIVTYAIEGTAYLEKVLLSTEALSAYIGIGLVFDFIESCRIGEKIDDIVYGYHTPSDPSLSAYKEALGFKIAHIPARVYINPIVQPLLKWRNPSAYYFITGKG